MGRFKNLTTDVVVSVDDSKSDRFADEWAPVEAEKKAPAKKAAPSKSEK